MAIMFTFHKLRSFIAVAEEQSLRRGAERLNISQPPLSRQISALEKSLGVPLFDRVGRGISLTYAGTVFLHEAKSLVAAADRTVQLTLDAHAGKIGSIRVGYTEPSAFDFLPHVLARFRQEYPGVDLELHEMHSLESLSQLEQRTIDVAYLRPPIESNWVELTMLHPDRLIVALPENHPITAESIWLEDLKDEPFIGFSAALGSGISSASLQACASAGFTPRTKHYVSSIPMLMSMVASGAGIALISNQYSLIPYLGVRFAALYDERAESYLAFASRNSETKGSVSALKRLSMNVSAELFD